MSTVKGIYIGLQSHYEVREALRDFYAHLSLLSIKCYHYEIFEIGRFFDKPPDLERLMK